MGLLRTALSASMLLASTNAALEPIVQKGTKFFTKSGEQFYLKGVAYQAEGASGGEEGTPTTKYVDPLADESICERDVPILEKLGVNTIRTYAINPDKDHSACMKLLDDAGIYVIADLGEPALSINRDTPAWNVELFERYQGVIDNLGKFDNVIGFFAGNEVTNNATNTPASAFVKAAVRDSKKYIADNNDRWMGVGYAANDDAEIRNTMAHYFNCGDEAEAIDFWGYNIYSWCGQSSFTKSGYDVQVDFFSNFSVPVFFAEYGCNTVGGAEGRTWDDTTALFSSQMTDVFSGGIAYMFHQEENDYGLVKVTGKSAKTMKNYDALREKFAKVDPSTTKMSAYSPTNSPAACPATSDDWQAAKDLPPTPDSSLCDCMFSAISCAPASNLDEKDFGDMFDYICTNDEKACAGIKQDTESGVYGPYGMCNPKQQLGHVLDAYYTNQKQASDACDFKGAAQVMSSPKAASSCDAKLAKASSQVAAAATATSASEVGDDSGSDTSDSAAPGLAPMNPIFTLGNVAVGLYMLVAMGAGAAMIAL